VAAGVFFVSEEGEFGGGKLFLGFKEGEFGCLEGAGEWDGERHFGQADERIGIVDGKGAAAWLDDDVCIGSAFHEEGAVRTEGIAESAEGVGFVVGFEVFFLDEDFAAVDFGGVDGGPGVVGGGAEKELFVGGPLGVGEVRLSAAEGEEECHEEPGAGAANGRGQVSVTGRFHSFRSQIAARWEQCQGAEERFAMDSKTLRRRRFVLEKCERSRLPCGCRQSEMLELIQFPWSPYCIVQRRILEYSGAPFKITNVPNTDRSLVWKLTRQRYYQVPILRDGHDVLFETDGNSQVIAKYLDQKLSLGLFPRQWEGLQDLTWRYFEEEIEGLTFKLNDIYWQEFLPAGEALEFIRHKERRFGRGCLELWRTQQKSLLKELKARLVPCEEMLLTREYLLDEVPRFLDFDLFGMLGNFLYSGHYDLPGPHKRLAAWYKRMAKTTVNQFAREKLHT
jgi:glutathione S-transferase